MVVLPVQIAAPTLLRATRTSPISAAYTAGVEDNLELRRLFDAFFKCRSRVSFFGAPAGVRKNALAEAAAATYAHQQNGCGAPTDVMNRCSAPRYGSESSGYHKQAQRHRFILPARVTYKRDGQHDRANSIAKFMRNIECHPTLSISQLPKDELERAHHGLRRPQCRSRPRPSREAGAANCKTPLAHRPGRGTEAAHRAVTHRHRMPIVNAAMPPHLRASATTPGVSCEPRRNCRVGTPTRPPPRR
jgi:hypothetical protein